MTQHQLYLVVWLSVFPGLHPEALGW